MYTYVGKEKIDLVIERLKELKENPSTCNSIREVNVREMSILKGDCKNCYKENTINIEITYIENFKK